MTPPTRKAATIDARARTGARRALAGIALAALGAAACGSHGGGDGDASGRTTSAPVAAIPANTVGGFAMQLPAVTLGPGEEQTPCWLLPLDVHGPSRIVGGARLAAPPGLHHGNITTRKKTGDGVRPCESTESDLGEIVDVLSNKGTVLFASTTQYQGTEWMTFPEGMGFPIDDGFEIVAHMHYLNATTKPISVAPSYEWYTIDESKVTQRLAPFAWANRNFKIPPHAQFTADADCDFDQPMHIVAALPHMHRMGTGFTASLRGGAHDGERFLDSPGYAPDTSVWREFSPAVDLGVAEGMRFSCTWTNTLDETLEWGVGDNEMCVLFGYAYPPENAYSVLASGESCARFLPFAGP